MMPVEYQPIFFDDDWVMPQHQGWTVCLKGPKLRVLQKSYGVMTRVLVLCTDTGDTAIGAALRQSELAAAPSEIIVRDFAPTAAAARTINGRRFVPVEESERLLNKATFVIDLAKSEETLFGRLRESYRRKIKRAIAAGVTFASHDAPVPAIVDGFVGAYQDMAVGRGLRLVRGSDIERMLERGHLLLCMAGGASRSYAAIYVCAGKGYYLYGASSGASDPVVGTFLHYEIMRQLKSRGLRWYDLGGVPAIDESNGIYQFKKGFGGELINFGQELVHRPVFVRGVRTGVRALRRLQSLVAA
jgi:hypothetical protein